MKKKYIYAPYSAAQIFVFVLSLLTETMYASKKLCHYVCIRYTCIPSKKLCHSQKVLLRNGIGSLKNMFGEWKI